MYAVGVMPLYPVGLLEVRVQFHLVGCGLGGGFADQLVHLVGGEVRDTDVADFIGLEEFFHGVPGLYESEGVSMDLLEHGVEEGEGIKTYVDVAQ